MNSIIRPDVNLMIMRSGNPRSVWVHSPRQRKHGLVQFGAVAVDVLDTLDIVGHIDVYQIGACCPRIIPLKGGLGDTRRTANIRKRCEANLDDDYRGCIASAVLRPTTCHIEMEETVAEWNQSVVDAAIKSLRRQTT